MREPIAAVAVLAALSGACSGQPPSRNEAPEPIMTSPSRVVTGLPAAEGLSFGTLDAYLAHLRSQSAFDVPHYEEVEPGVYELIGGRRPRGAAPQRFTRAELARRYGFDN